MSDRPTSEDPPSLSHEVDEQEDRQLTWKALVRRGLPVLIAGLGIYFVFPAIPEVLASWPRLSTLEPVWFVLAVAFQVGHFVCTFGLQRLALRTKAWFPVVTSELASNAVNLIIPGGTPLSVAVQIRMLSTSGLAPSSTIGGLTAFSVLGVGGLLALPVFALPVILFSVETTNRGLVNAAILGAIGFVVLAVASAVVLATDMPLRRTARAMQRARNWALRKRAPLTGLDESLLEERNRVRRLLGRQWWQAVLLSAGRLALDYLCLLAAIRATGARPNASLILVAYAAAGVIQLIPITPGGLGIVEASLTGLLVLAGVSSSDALLATLTYRLASYWVPLAAGPIAYGAFLLRYRAGLSTP
ncbi:MAG: flippase-like domain-containing protein [Acidimicrobiaceae bacterium]|nr:flippase-like domain-containing protein [Acidimicrobiaceae bacterium]